VKSHEKYNMQTVVGRSLVPKPGGAEPRRHLGGTSDISAMDPQCNSPEERPISVIYDRLIAQMILRSATWIWWPKALPACGCLSIWSQAPLVANKFFLR
jgi:hypothetical protein